MNLVKRGQYHGQDACLVVSIGDTWCGEIWMGWFTIDEADVKDIEDSMKQKYTIKDLGKFANGELGRPHCREVLATMVTNLYKDRPEWKNIEHHVQALLGPETEDLWEEDIGLDLLSDVCSEDVYFDFDDDGSLSLVHFDLAK